MSFNFPLILVLATAVTGLVWLLDIFVLRPRRDAAVAAARERLGNRGGEAALEDLRREPLWVEYSISFFPVLAIVLILRSFLAEPFQIPSGSMIPTLEIGDFIVVNKFAYGIRLPVIGTKVIDIGEPANGDVMVFFPPHKDEYFIKRVIGIPGDRVRYVDKTLFINGVEQPQAFVARIPPNAPRYVLFDETIGGAEHRIRNSVHSDERVGEWVVPEGHYFVMGDNRDESSDSRYWGFVPDENIVGKAFAIWMHKDPGLSMPEFSRNGWIE